MSNSVTVRSNNGLGLGLGSILFVVFLVLKLTGVIAWSWWWVTAPLWIPVAAGVVVAAVGVLIYLKMRRAEKKRLKARAARQTALRARPLAAADR